MKNELTRQIIYRSCYRGCKETDFLIGNFVKTKIDDITDLELFDEFLNQDDAEIYDWILQKTPTPEKFASTIKQIQDFHFTNQLTFK